MFAVNSASKSSSILFQLTPAKLIVNYDINSWNETSSKQQIIYRHKRKKMPKTKQEVQAINARVTTNLAKLRSYRQNLLNSQVKKLSEKTLPTSSPESNPKVKLTRRGKPFQFQIRSLSRSRQVQNDRKDVFVISEFDCNAQIKGCCEVKRQIQKDNLSIGGPLIIPKGRGKTLSMPKPERSISRGAVARNITSSQTSIGMAAYIGRPQQYGVSLISRRLISAHQ